MKKLLLRLAGTTVALGVAVGSIPGFAQQAVTGNGTPSGAHYELNIIGVTYGQESTADGFESSHNIRPPQYCRGRSCSWDGHLADSRSFRGL
jgi:hypothetical protein